MTNSNTPLSADQCQEIIRGSKNLDPIISDVKFSNEVGFKTGIAESFARIHAKAASIVSLAFSSFMNEVNQVLINNTPGTTRWISIIIKKFQYGDALKEDMATLMPFYSIVNPSKRIITNCSAVTNENGKIIIKIAKGTDVLEPLTMDELDAAKDYYSAFAPAGIITEFVSKRSDKLYLKAQIFYKGQYAGTIQEDVKIKIKQFLETLPFDGTLIISALEESIKSVTGVVDLVLKDVWAREDSTPIANATKLISDYTQNIQGSVILRNWQTHAGYMSPESTTGYTLLDTGILTFTLSK